MAKKVKAKNNPDAGANSVINAKNAVIKSAPVRKVTNKGKAKTTSVANAKPVIIPARFLPGTVLKQGAEGETFKILQQRLFKLYHEGFISAMPFSVSAVPNYDDSQTWNVVKAYIDQGISYKSQSAEPILSQKSKAGNYNVDKLVWESLDLPIASTWEDMFGSISTSGQTIRMNLTNNMATLIWRPKFIVYKYDTKILTINEHGYEYTIETPIYEPYLETDPEYIKQVENTLNGALRWSNPSVRIQGVTGSFDIEIRDKSDKKYVAGDTLSNYDFMVDKKKDANVLIYVEPKYKAWVPDSFWWGYNKKLKIETYIKKTDASDRVMEHEFGHVIGIFDAYGYGSHFGPLEWVLPAAPVDGKYVQSSSVMLCDYGASHSFTRTAFDYEMILFAWKSNELQLYVDSIAGPMKKTQAYYYCEV